MWAATHAARMHLMKAAAAVLAITTSGAAQAQTPAEWDAVIAGAKREGVVHVYQSQHATPHWQAVVKDFESRYGVKVQVYDARASELTEKIRVEQTSGRFLGDLEFHGSTTILQQRESNFILKHGGVPNAVHLRADFPADEYSVPAWVQTVCFLINTNLVKPGEEPKEWRDLLDPKWKGRILTDDMRVQGTGHTLFAVFHRVYGREILEKLRAQDLVVDRDLRMSSRRVARGEYAIYLTQQIALASDLKGLPIKVVSPSDGCPYTPIRSAMLRGAPHPNAARLFMNHFIDMKSQLAYGNAWVGTVVKGVAEKLSTPEARAHAQVKLMGEIEYHNRAEMLNEARAMMK